MKRFLRILKSPALHFLLIGGLLFAGDQLWEIHRKKNLHATKEELRIGADQIEQIKRDLFTQTGRRPNPAQVEAAIQIAIDEEILYREALELELDENNPAVRQRLIQVGKFVSENPQAGDKELIRKARELGLDKSDLVVRRQLIGTMQLIAKKVPTSKQPSQVTSVQLQDYLQHHSEEFTIPPRVEFIHVYLSRDKRGPRTEGDARDLLKQLERRGILPAAALELGDSFLQGNHFSGVTASILEKSFGVGFADKVLQIEVGRWAGPIPSSYGWHLVWVQGLKPSELPPLMQVANQVKKAILREREGQRLKDTLDELRSRYSIRVENSEAQASPLAKGGPSG
jgi:hypothetical protein